MSDAGWAKAQEANAINKSRARAALSRRPVGLGDQRDYFEKMAADETVPKRERDLWQRLADEVTARLNDRDTDPDDQSVLF